MPRRRSVRTILSRALIVVGAVLLLFGVGYEAVGYPWRTLFSGKEELNIDRLPDPTPPDLKNIEVLVENWEDPYAEESAQPSSEASAAEPSLQLPGNGDNYLNFAGADGKVAVSYPPVVVIGAVKIPKLDVSVNLVEGTNTRDLLVGAGHVSYTPAIGKKGNVSIAGHRVTRTMHPFRHLDKMEPGDLVILKNDAHTYTYSTLETFVVKNTESWVMGRVESVPYCLTLITCHPVGSARERLILRAELTEVDGVPASEFYVPSQTPQSPAPASSPPSEIPSGETPEPSPGEAGADGETPSESPEEP